LAATAALNGHARTLGPSAVAVASVALHLMAVAVWVGGLATLVMLGGVAWRTLEPDLARALLATLIPRFSRVALVAVGVVVVTGAVNAFLALASVSDLWRTAYGRVLSAKILLLAMALVLAARHLWVVPRRLAPAAPGGGQPTVASFERSAAAELALLGAAVAFASVLVTLVPGRTLAEAAAGPVNQERRVGQYTAQLFVDPSAVGANQLHITFVNAQGLGAAEITNTDVAVGRVGAPLEAVPMRLISSGHFVGDATLPVRGGYRLSVRAGSGAAAPSTTFEFRLSRSRD
jgi:copper transport protein